MSVRTRQIVADLTESLRTTTGLHHLLEMVATKIQAVLQTANGTIFFSLAVSALLKGGDAWHRFTRRKVG